MLVLQFSIHLLKNLHFHSINVNSSVWTAILDSVWAWRASSISSTQFRFWCCYFKATSLTNNLREIVGDIWVGDSWSLIYSAEVSRMLMLTISSLSMLLVWLKKNIRYNKVNYWLLFLILYFEGKKSKIKRNEICEMAQNSRWLWQYCCQ